MSFMSKKQKLKTILAPGPARPRILVIRNDGLGDFILTLPLVESLKKQLPTSHVYVLVNSAFHKLAATVEAIDGVIEDCGVFLKRHDRKFNRREKKIKQQEIESELRAYNFDMVVLAYPEKRTARLVSKLKIPIRVGTGRRSYSWRLNYKSKISRKGSKKSEYALNLKLLKAIGLRADYERPVLLKKTLTSLNAKAKKLKNKVVIHPYKRNDTALSWPIEKFKELARLLHEKKHQIVFIGDNNDEAFLTEHFSGIPGSEIVTGIDLHDMPTALSQAALFIGNSSGPLHLAALAGICHVGIYPQNNVSSARRWRTLPLPDKKKLLPFTDYLLQPNLDKECITCEKEQCIYFNCLETILVRKVFEAAQKQLDMLPAASRSRQRRAKKSAEASKPQNKSPRKTKSPAARKPRTQKKRGASAARKGSKTTAKTGKTAGNSKTPPEKKSSQ